MFSDVVSSIYSTPCATLSSLITSGKKQTESERVNKFMDENSWKPSENTNERKVKSNWVDEGRIFIHTWVTKSDSFFESLWWWGDLSLCTLLSFSIATALINSYQIPNLTSLDFTLYPSWAWQRNNKFPRSIFILQIFTRNISFFSAASLACSSTIIKWEKERKR